MPMTYKITASSNKLYHREVIVATNNNNKNHYNNSIPKDPDHNKWSNFYHSANLYRDITGCNYNGPANTRELSLTITDNASIDQFNNRFKRLRKQYTDIFNKYICVRGLQPATGHIHLHSTLFNIDPRIDNQQYRDYIQSLWIYGDIQFDYIDNIYAWTQYCIDHMRPDSPKYIPGERITRFSYGRLTEKPVYESYYSNAIPIHDTNEILNSYYHNHSSGITYYLKTE